MMVFSTVFFPSDALKGGNKEQRSLVFFASTNFPLEVRSVLLAAGFPAFVDGFTCKTWGNFDDS